MKRTWCPSGIERLLLAASVSATGPALIGCDMISDLVTQKVSEKVTEKAIEKHMGGGEVDIDRSGNGVSIKGKDSKGKEVSFQAGAKLPDDWPKEVPVYPGAKIENSMSFSKSTWALTLATPDPQAKVIDFYKAKLSSMEEKGNFDNGAQKMLVLTSKAGEEKVQVSVAAMREENASETKIQLGVNKKATK